MSSVIPVFKALLLAFAGTMLSLVSDFLGLIFVTAIGGRLVLGNPRSQYWYLLGTVLFGGMVWTSGLVDDFVMQNLMLGMLLCMGVYFWALSRTLHYIPALFSAFSVYIMFTLGRQLLMPDFNQTHIDAILQANRSALDLYLAQTATEPGQLPAVQELLDSATRFLSTYQVGLWCLQAMLAMYIGSLMASRYSWLKWRHSHLELPKSLIWAMMVFMVLMLLPQTSVLGGNGLMILAVLYLMRGFAVLDYYWGPFLRSSLWLMIMLILSFIINPALLVAVIITGLLDNWFDLRKLHKLEEIKNEDNPD